MVILSRFPEICEAVGIISENSLRNPPGLEPLGVVSELFASTVCHTVKKLWFRYYCKTSNIAKYNEEVRIICERYEIYCEERIPSTLHHVCVFSLFSCSKFLLPFW